MDSSDSNNTYIYLWHNEAEERVGALDAAGQIVRSHGRSGKSIGYVSAANTVIRLMTHDEREVGYFTVSGRIYSHGLLEGGEIGWVEGDGTVVRAGLIFGEEEVGRVEGPRPLAAGAALLLIFIPDADEDRKDREKHL